MSNRPICDVDTPDPWIIAANGQFYMTFTLGNRVEIWASGSLEDFRNCRKSLIWEPRDSGWVPGIWAPELHQLNGIWYVYFCGEKPGQGNPSHRTLVLRSRLQDPMDRSGWEFVGPLRGIPDHWNIDATVFSPRPNELYCCYSGWPLGDHSDTQQDLFLIKLASPEVAIENTLVCISRASLPWERPDGGRRGVNEGPTWVSLPGFQGIVYSAHGSWTSEYKLGIIQLVGNDPLKESSWRKRNAPLLVADPSRGGPFGPGHASFIASPYNDGHVYCIYHGTEKQNEGWNNRKARVMLMGPEHFRSEAAPLCCSIGGGSNQSHGQSGFPGGPNFFQQRVPGQVGGILDKVANKAMKKLREL